MAHFWTWFVGKLGFVVFFWTIGIHDKVSQTQGKQSGEAVKLEQKPRFVSMLPPTAMKAAGWATGRNAKTLLCSLDVLGSSCFRWKHTQTNLYPLPHLPLLYLDCPSSTVEWRRSGLEGTRWDEFESGRQHREPCQAKQTNSFLKMDPGTRSSLVSFQATLEAWKRVIAVNRVGYAGHARVWSWTQKHSRITKLNLRVKVETIYKSHIYSVYWDIPNTHAIFIICKDCDGLPCPVRFPLCTCPYDLSVVMSDYLVL